MHSRLAIPMIALAIGFPYLVNGQPAPVTIAKADSTVLIPPAMDRPLVQVALLLDTSNSMDGLILQAQSQLWTIVNEISRARRNGQMPRLQVALIEYGNDNLAAGEGFIRTVLPFTDNLDDISEKLFALRTNGGSEFCGHAIRQATDTLAWSGDANVYKAIFIAGNEPFGQGSVDYHSSCTSSIGRGVVVNTIHCGDRKTGIEGGWAEGAKLGEGYFSNIDQNRDVQVVPCPQDKEIETLSIEINVTYLPYGKAGADSIRRQAAQDENALQNSARGSSIQRAECKANAIYDNQGWDLVDAVTAGKVDLDKIDAKDLPEAMQSMTPGQRLAYVKDQASKRTDIRDRLNTLIAERARHLAGQQTTQPSDAVTLDTAIIESLREQLNKQKYAIENR